MAGPKRVLLLAENLRLPYRVLRCAAACFDDIYVLGAPGAVKLGTSKHCRRYFDLGESFGSFDPASVERINAICASYDIGQVLPSCAVTARYLSLHGRALHARHYPVPSVAVFDQLDDKWRFAALCVSLGVPCPRTRCVPTIGDLLGAGGGEALRFPLVLKPLSLWGSLGVRRIDRAEDLPARFEHTPILVQDFVPGEDVCAFFVCREGAVVASVQYRRAESRVVFIHDEEIDRNARLIIDHTAYDGVIGFDVRRTPDGRIHFIECNPRFWYRIHLALIAGTNFVEAGFRAKDAAVDRAKAGRSADVLAHRDILLHLLLPWRLNRHDRALLRYLASDPIPMVWAAVERAFDPALATGALL